MCSVQWDKDGPVGRCVWLLWLLLCVLVCVCLLVLSKLYIGLCDNSKHVMICILDFCTKLLGHSIILP